MWSSFGSAYSTCLTWCVTLWGGITMPFVVSHSKYYDLPFMYGCCCACTAAEEYRRHFPTQRILAKDGLCSPHSTGNWFSSIFFCAVWKGSATTYEQMWEHSEDGSGKSMTLHLFELPLCLFHWCVAYVDVVDCFISW